MSHAPYVYISQLRSSQVVKKSCGKSPRYPPPTMTLCPFDASDRLPRPSVASMSRYAFLASNFVLVPPLLPTAAVLLVFNTSKNFHMATRTICVAIRRIYSTPSVFSFTRFSLHIWSLHFTGVHGNVVPTNLHHGLGTLRPTKSLMSALVVM